MFLLGHIGITVAIVYLAVLYFSSRQGKGSPGVLSIQDIDFRFVIIAAVMPDIIDKIIGLFLLKDEFSNGRLFTHSMVTIGIVTICLLILAQIRLKNRIKFLYYVSPLWIHLLLDRMWEEPKTLFWPMFGTSFPRLDVEFTDYFTLLFSNPYILAGEILGISIIIILFLRHRLFINHHFMAFLKDGELKTST